VALSGVKHDGELFMKIEKRLILVLLGLLVLISLVVPVPLRGFVLPGTLVLVGSESNPRIACYCPGQGSCACARTEMPQE